MEARRSNDGTIFSVGTNGSGFQNLLSFSGTAGTYPGLDPFGNLTEVGTNLYGMTAGGGSSNAGTVFEIGTNGSGFQNLISFTGNAGAFPGSNPWGSLTLSGATMYGVTKSSNGTVFRLGIDGSGFQSLYAFGFTGNPDAPVGTLVLSGTTLYGMTSYGGNGENGSVFSIGINGSGYQNLLLFSGTAGAYPGRGTAGSLLLSGTTLYGMTRNGGTSGDGNVFSVGTNGTGFQNLLSFSGTTGAYPGWEPDGSLVLIGTNLYGMTQQGRSDAGTVFSVGTNGSGFRSLVSFTGTNGANPLGDLTPAASAAVGLAGPVNATIISGGTAAFSATVTNTATSSTLYGMTSQGSIFGNVFSLTVSGANNLSYTLGAAVQSGSATVGPVTSGTGSLASGASQPCTFSATSTHLGVNAIAFTASDPNSSNLSQTTTATLTVLDHAAAAFSDSSTVLTLNFGTLQVGSGTQSLQFQIENLPAQFRAGLDLDSVTVLSDLDGVFSTDATSFTDLAPGSMSNELNVFLKPSQIGEFSGEYQFNLSDETDLSGHGGAQTLTLNVTADVVPEPSTLALLGVGAIGLLRYGWRRRKPNP